MPTASPAIAFRLGSVSYLNSKPLIYGLDEADDLSLTLDVPAKLIDGLRDESVDIALLPIIDYQRLPGLCVVPVGGIGSNGQTLTVRIFSRVPIEQIRTLACDVESHTSVALATVLLAEVYGIDVRRVPLEHDGRANLAEARLLIGDKVVCEEPAGFPHQLDLGEAWKKHTGLPFVFAAWIARAGVDLGDLPARLESAKRDGLGHVDELVERYAVPRGWPAELARRYMTDFLKYDIGEPELTAIRLFHEKAAAHGLVQSPARPLVIYRQ